MSSEKLELVRESIRRGIRVSMQRQLGCGIEGCVPDHTESMSPFQIQHFTISFSGIVAVTLMQQEKRYTGVCNGQGHDPMRIMRQISYHDCRVTRSRFQARAAAQELLVHNGRGADVVYRGSNKGKTAAVELTVQL